MLKKIGLSESAVRRKALSLGFKVRKSRGRAIHANDLGEYMLVWTELNSCVIGENFNASLEDIDSYLSS